VGGLGKYVTCQFLSFFSFFFAYFATRPGRISLPVVTIYTPKRLLAAKDVPFGGFDNTRLHLGVKPKKRPQNGREWAFRSQIGEDVKSHNRSPMKIFASNFTHRLSTGALSKEMHNYIINFKLAYA